MNTKANIWTQSQGIFYMHQAPVVDDCNAVYVPNMKNINPFFSGIHVSQTHQIYEKYCHNYSNLAWSQMLFYKHEQKQMVLDYYMY